MKKDIYRELAKHLSTMGLPFREELVNILRENFSIEEARVVMLLPTMDIPFQPVTLDVLAASSRLDRDRLIQILEELANRGLIYSGGAKSDDMGYALNQPGFGFPQTFFWKGEKTQHAINMSKMVLKYFNRDVTCKTFGGKKTKPYRYIPINHSIEPNIQSVLPHDRMDTVIRDATRFAVAHCSCRVGAELMGRTCGHPKEVCLKFDEMADYLIERGFGREITRDQAREIVQHAADIGLVHFVDNAAGKVKHNCNCCGCACWNVGNIRRRKIPRDELMAVYFQRETDSEQCVGCGECILICPVNAIRVEDGNAVIDSKWCIGCGVCAIKCDFEAVIIKYREDEDNIPQDFKSLHKEINQIRKEEMKELKY